MSLIDREALLRAYDSEHVGPAGRARTLIANAPIINAVLDEDLGIICVCAVRYSLGRQTYMPSLVADFIKRNINNIDTKDLFVIKKDIDEAEQMGYGYGDEIIDKPVWMNLLYTVTKEIEKRNEPKKVF